MFQTVARGLHVLRPRGIVRILTLFLLVLIGASADDPKPRMYTDDPSVARGQAVLWHDPGAVAQLDFRYGIGGKEQAPQAPFTFVKEDSTGTSPKVIVQDANGRTWSIKFGPEASPDTFSSRMVWAVGYWVETNYFVSQGVIRGAHDLSRARRDVDAAGNFHDARFQLRSDHPKYLQNVNWNWDGNPFVGTPELNGLKIMMMLLSNWDDKDFRDASTKGANTAIFDDRGRYIFFIDDWGASMGNWGKVLTRSKWNCMDYDRQSRRFVKSLQNSDIEWAYIGQHTHLITDGIRISDVKWLVPYLSAITGRQLHDGLISSGASEEDARYCIDGIRTRIRELETVANSPAVTGPRAN